MAPTPEELAKLQEEVQAIRERERAEAKDDEERGSE